MPTFDFEQQSEKTKVKIKANGSASEIAALLSMVKTTGTDASFQGPETELVQRAIEYLYPITAEIEPNYPQLPQQSHYPTDIGYPGSPPMPALPPAPNYPAIAPTTQIPIPQPTQMPYPQTREEEEVLTALRSLDPVTTGFQVPTVNYPPAQTVTRRPPTPTMRRSVQQKPKTKIGEVFESTVSNYLVAAVFVAGALFVFRGNELLSFFNSFNKPSPTPTATPSIKPDPANEKRVDNPNPPPMNIAPPKPRGM